MFIMEPQAGIENDVAKWNHTQKCSCSAVKRTMWTTKENEQKDLIFLRKGKCLEAIWISTKITVVFSGW